MRSLSSSLATITRAAFCGVAKNITMVSHPHMAANTPANEQTLWRLHGRTSRTLTPATSTGQGGLVPVKRPLSRVRAVAAHTVSWEDGFRPASEMHVQPLRRAADDAGAPHPVTRYRLSPESRSESTGNGRCETKLTSMSL